MAVLKEDIYKTKYAKPEIFEWYSKRGAVSIFLYSRSVLKNGVLGIYDDGNRAVRSVSKNGEIYVPECFFEKYLDVELSKDSDVITLTRGKKSLTAKLDEETYILDGHTYLPAIKTAEALGVKGSVFDDGKLAVFASASMLDEIERDIELQVSASYATLGKYDASKFTKEDFETVKSKWRTVLVGSEEINDLSDPDFCEKLAEISRDTKTSWDSLNKNEDRFILWGDEPPTESADLTRQYRNIWTLTQGYAVYGSEYYQNEELKNTIIDCFQWMYEHMYGEAEIEDRGWRSMRIFNWWDWFWGGIEPMTNALIVMENHLTYEQIKTWLRAFKHALTIHQIGEHGAMSRLTVCTKTALLLEDRAMLENECTDYDQTLNVTRSKNGIHVDYVSWSHEFPYNIIYGFNNLSRTGFVGTLLGGTPIEYVSPKQYELFNIARYMFETICYKGQGFMGFAGRTTSNSEFQHGIELLNGLLPLIGLFGEDEDMHLKKFIKRCVSTPRIEKMLKSFCSVYNFSKLMGILRDDTISAKNDYEIGYAWYTADRFAQHRNDYAFFVALTSNRHPSYESINGVNRRGWYTCDGSLYYYNNTDRNAFDGVNFITNPAICQRIPGTTVDDRERQPWSYAYGKWWKNPNDFSGTMDVEKKYGMAAFEYESYHYDGHEADGTEDTGYGGKLTYWENDLVARKSYYFFDKECVCLGAGINSTMGSNVITTVEHRRLVKNKSVIGEEDVYLDGELMPKENYETVKEGAKWANLEGFAGYVLPSGGKVHLLKYTYVPNMADLDLEYLSPDPDAELYKNGKPFFEINLYHGKNPKGAKYEYIILPNASAEETKAYSESPEVEIISNTKKLQAVRKPSLGLAFITFYEAGECAGVKASEPCIVSILEKDGEMTVSVADPTHKTAEIKLTLDKKYTLIKRPHEAFVSERCGRTVIAAKTEGLTGEAVRVSFKR